MNPISILTSDSLSEENISPPCCSSSDESPIHSIDLWVGEEMDIVFVRCETCDRVLSKIAFESSLGNSPFVCPDHNRYRITIWGDGCCFYCAECGKQSYARAISRRLFDGIVSSASKILAMVTAAYAGKDICPL